MRFSIPAGAEPPQILPRPDSMELSPELYVTLKVGPDQAFEAPVLEVNWGEALASFPADAAPVLSIGQAVELDFRGPRIPGAAHVRGFVILRAEEERVRLYRFQLDRGDGTALHAAVNRRATFRVTPDPAAPVRIAVRSRASGGRRVPVLLRDISEGGVSFLVSKEEEWTLSTWLTVELELSLPGADGPLVFGGDIRYRRLERTAVQYGIRFDTQEEGFEAKQALVRAYVASRRRQMLQRVVRSGPDAA